MATPGWIVSAQTYQILSDLYLDLWQQLVHVSGEDRWSQVQPESGTELHRRVEETVRTLSPDASSTVYKDYAKTQDFILNGLGTNRADVIAREYLRDTGLRFAQFADEVDVTAQ